MNGLICLQGGNEFRPDCRPMDEAWLARLDQRRTCIAPLACAAGVEYRTAAENGATYLGELGITDLWMAPEPDLSMTGAVRAIVDADIVVIPGGSPRRALRRVQGTAIGGALRAHVAAGGTIVGASAGAMILAGQTLLPGDDMQVHPGLGLVPGVLVLPHYDGARDDLVARVAGQVSSGTTIVGVPSCCGVLFGNGGGEADPTALGDHPSWRLTADADPVPIALD